MRLQTVNTLRLPISARAAYRYCLLTVSMTCKTSGARSLESAGDCDIFMAEKNLVLSRNWRLQNNQIAHYLSVVCVRTCNAVGSEHTFQCTAVVASYVPSSGVWYTSPLTQSCSTTAGRQRTGVQLPKKNFRPVVDEQYCVMGKDKLSIWAYGCHHLVNSLRRKLSSSGRTNAA